jgi:AcrR family transcriptional regulator
MARPTRQPAATRSRRAANDGEGAEAPAPKRTQRERLLDAMVELAARHGYQAVSIAQVSSLARVSSATFYEQFASKDECLAAAYRAVADRVLGQMEPVARETLSSDKDWTLAARAAIGRVFSAVANDPLGGRVLYIESMAGGPGMLEQRGQVLEAFEQRTRDFLDSTPDGAGVIDLPVEAVIGATRSIVSRHLRTNSEDQLTTLAGDLVTWVQSYSAPPGHERWSTGPRAVRSVGGARRRREAGTGRPAAQRLPRGRHGLPAAVVTRSQRTRIVNATAEVTMSKGYASTTVADIVAAAGVSRDVFYEHFADKHDAFLEAQQHSTQYILDTCAAAYFAVDGWPRRIWQGLRRLIDLTIANPALAHLRLVECYAAGPDAVRRAEEITRSFTLFLEEGYRCRPQAEELPRLSSLAIAGAIFEIIRRHIAKDDGVGLMGQLPRLSYIAIAPFAGPVDAIRQIEELSAERAPRRR